MNVIKLFGCTTAAVCGALLMAADLPSEYPEAKWIQSTGTQWVNTEYIPVCTDKIRVEFSCQNVAHLTAPQFLFCSRGVNNANTFSCLLQDDGKLRFDRKDGSVGMSGKLANNADYILEIDGDLQTYFLNGVSQTCKSTDAFTPDNPIVLFGGYSGVVGDEAVSYRGTFRVLRFKVVGLDGTTKVDLVPCADFSAGVIGFYDVARGSFHGNSGSGALLAEERFPAAGLPAGFTKARWVQSSGTQWVNTEYTPACTDTIYLKFACLDVDSGAPQFLFCSRGVKNANTFSCLLQADGTLRFDRKDGSVGMSGKLVQGRSNLMAEDGNAQVYLLNGVSQTCKSTDAFTPDNPIVLFGGYSGDVSDEAVSYRGAFRLFQFRVVGSDGKAKAELVPCVRNSDAQPGFYDLVRGNFFGNCGTGVLSASCEKGLKLLVW